MAAPTDIELRGFLTNLMRSHATLKMKTVAEHYEKIYRVPAGAETRAKIREIYIEIQGPLARERRRSAGRKLLVMGGSLAALGGVFFLPIPYELPLWLRLALVGAGVVLLNWGLSLFFAAPSRKPPEA